MNLRRPPTVDVIEAPSAGTGIWLFAGTAALTLHLALVAFAVAHLHEEPEQDDLGAPALTIGIELASPQAPPSDLPPGPDSEASVASPAMVEQQTTVTEAELPKEIPVEADEPDRLVTMDDVKAPKEEDVEVKPQATTPSEASVAQEATAMPAIENVPDAPTSVTRDQGTGASKQRVRLTWQRELVAHIDKHKRYPAEHRQKSAEIVVSLELDRVGRVVSAAVTKSSGDSAFDAAALAMVHRASPVPAPPPLIADDGLVFSLPVIFRMHGKR